MGYKIEYTSEYGGYDAVLHVDVKEYKGLLHLGCAINTGANTFGARIQFPTTAYIGRSPVGALHGYMTWNLDGTFIELEMPHSYYNEATPRGKELAKAFMGSEDLQDAILEQYGDTMRETLQTHRQWGINSLHRDIEKAQDLIVWLQSQIDLAEEGQGFRQAIPDHLKCK